MSSPECSIVSLTVTEGGYFIDHASKTFLHNHPDLQFDLRNSSTPKTFLGYLTEACDRRMRHGLPPFTVMSCDNLQGNGNAAREAVLAFADMKNSDLRRWIERTMAFPNSMVDRITPMTTEADRTFIKDRFGVEDRSPVVAEPFRQWVLEDEFSGERPNWESVGAQIVSDVTPFERVKMRLLNGGHSTIAYVSALLGIEFVSDALNDPLVHGLLLSFLDEVTPSLPELTGMELTPYKQSIVKRFSNPTIRDQIQRLCGEGSAKIAKFIIPTINDLRAEGRSCSVIPLVIACWLLSMRGVDQQGKPFTVVDASSEAFRPFALTGFRDALVALSVRSVFGELATDAEFTSLLQSHLNALHTNSIRDVIRQGLDAAKR
jgi:mannitol 2-dehydrogenase